MEERSGSWTPHLLRPRLLRPRLPSVSLSVWGDLKAQERFRDRTEAGRQLAFLLQHHRESPNLIVLGLPRGGIPVAYEVAELLCVPLDVFVVRKLGVPGHEELAMGAVATGGIRHLNTEVVEDLHIPAKTVDEVTAREQARVGELDSVYRKGQPPLDLEGRVAILVDDGLATGSTMIAAVSAVRTQRPSSVVVAVPVAAPQVAVMLRSIADEVVVVSTPLQFWAVGAWYDRFDQVSDEQVMAILGKAP